MKKLLLLLIFFAIISNNLQAQIDKIKQRVDTLPNTSKEKIDKLNELSEVYGKLADIYAKRNKGIRISHSEAVNYAKQALKYSQNIRYKEGEARSLINLGDNIYNVEPDLEKSSNYYKRAIKIYKNSKNDKEVALIYEKVAFLYESFQYEDSDNVDKALDYFLKSLDTFQKLEIQNDTIKQEMSRVTDKIAELYFNKNNDAKALEYSNLSAKLLAESNLDYNQTKVIKNALEKNNAAQQRFIILMLVALALIVLSGFFLVRGVFQIRKKNRVLEQNKRDLETKTAEIRNKNKEIQHKADELQEKVIEIGKMNKYIQLNELDLEMQKDQLKHKTEELTIKTKELEEKNEEIHQLAEELATQRDNIQDKAEDLHKAYTTITALARFGQSITASLNFEEIVDMLHGYTQQMMPAEGFAILQYDDEKREAIFDYHVEDTHRQSLQSISINEKDNPFIWVVENTRSLIIRESSDYEQYKLKALSDKYSSAILTPMIHEGFVTGILAVQSEKINAYNLQDVDVLKTLASYTSIALSNAETYKQLEQAQNQLIEVEKMAALGNLVAGVAHEINTPVGICVTAASRLDSKTQDFIELYKAGNMKRTDLQNYLKTSLEGSKILMTNLKRAASLVQSFKSVAVKQSSEEERIFNLKTYIEETLMALQPELKNKPYILEFESEEDIMIKSHPGAFSQVITNFVMNSLIHGFKGKDEGTITLKAETKNKELIFTYQDNGNGMPPDIAQRIYEPFFTTNRDGGGSGLGMNIVYNLVSQKLGGTLNLKTSEGQGVKFTITLPYKKEEV